MKKRISRLAATLALGALAATGLALVDDLIATPQDTGWGAPDTSSTIVTGDADAGVGPDASIDTTLGDSGWG